jgi:hypothetical protein
MLKNVVIAGLSLLSLLMWIKVDPECVNNGEDPNAVTIEYQCSDLEDYENVPPEVMEECIKRANESTNRKTKP